MYNLKYWSIMAAQDPDPHPRFCMLWDSRDKELVQIIRLGWGWTYSWRWGLGMGWGCLKLPFKQLQKAVKWVFVFSVVRCDSPNAPNRRF